MPRIRKPSDMAEPFGLRLSAPALRACDELADVWEVNRQEALRRIVEAGLAACGRSGGAPSGSPLDLGRLAAVAARGASDAVLAMGRNGGDTDRHPGNHDVIEVHREGLEMGLMAVRGAVADLETSTGPNVAAALDRLRTGALFELEPYLPASARADSGAQGAPERRAPDSKPVRGGRRKAPRLTDADVGRWVREGDDARRYAHKMTRLRTGGTADTACGLAVDLRFAALSDDGRRCPKCGAP